eukprot:TRINITY_DN5391_c0_g1_i3.p1 TRINITY_DN5391_c0_g1~~TRINITY_DN5391_c0_g1_i3.p1  ORF type:complete len:549 (-),score=116.36 TRINITY_DN5391_c0_g1_i3:108-1754(-)
MVFKDPSYKVKNTFVEFAPADVDDPVRARRAQSDTVHRAIGSSSPLVIAQKSPKLSPLLQPVDETLQAMPIDEVDFELLEEACDPDAEAASPPVAEPGRRSRGASFNAENGSAVAHAKAGDGGKDEPAYVVPTTPSPFLHPSSFPPAQVVPPFGYGGFGGLDGCMGLPPAFDENGQEQLPPLDQQQLEALQGMAFPPEMFDPNFGFMSAYAGWPMNPDGTLVGFPGPGLEQGVVMLPEGLEPAPDAALPSSQLAAPQGDTALAASAAPAASEEAADGGDGKGAGKDNRRKRRDKAQPIAAEEDWREESRDANSRRGVTISFPGEEASHHAAADRASNGAAAGAGSAAPSKMSERHDRSERNSRGDRDRDDRDRDGEREKKPAYNRYEKKDLPCPEAATGDYTTVMLRNIPNKYTREMLIKQLCLDFNGQFDFMYLPIDFKNKCNVGYGFINFRKQEYCESFVDKFHGVDVRKCLPGLNSKKIVEVTPARVQGLHENVRRLRNSPVMNQLADHPEWMPLLFNDKGEEEPFPNPDQPLPPVKPRGRNNLK